MARHESPLEQRVVKHAAAVETALSTGGARRNADDEAAAGGEAPTAVTLVEMPVEYLEWVLAQKREDYRVPTLEDYSQEDVDDDVETICKVNASLQAAYNEFVEFRGWIRDVIQNDGCVMVRGEMLSPDHRGLQEQIDDEWAKARQELLVSEDAEAADFPSEMTSALGSLVVRLIFRPFEESNRLKFAEMASGHTSQTILSLRTSLVQCLKLNCLTGLLIIAFGPGYSYTLLRMAYKDKHCDGAAQLLLILYWFYVIGLAFNGTLEAFLQSVANESQLKMLNDFLLFLSVVYVSIKLLLIGYAGAVGLIVSNAINMLLRILYFVAFTRRFFRNSYAISIQEVVPSGWWVLLISGAATVISDIMVLNKKNKKAYWQTLPVHLGIGASCFLLSCAVIYPREKVLIEKVVKLHKHTD